MQTPSQFGVTRHLTADRGRRRNVNLPARLIWIAERLEEGDAEEAATVLRDLIEELES
jgi:hypothetical protein